MGPGPGPEPARCHENVRNRLGEGPRGQSCIPRHSLQFPRPGADPELRQPDSKFPHLTNTNTGRRLPPACLEPLGSLGVSNSALAHGRH